MENEAEERLLRKTYSEIIHGFSVTRYKEFDLYIKHPSALDSLDNDYLYTRYYEEAVSKGYPTEKERVDTIKNDGLWSDQDNFEIENIKTAIQNLQTFKRKAFRLADLQSLAKQIKEQEDDLIKKINKRENLIGATAEKFTSRKVDAFVISKSIFTNKSLTQLFFSEEDFDNLTTLEIEEVYDLYYNSLTVFLEKNIKKIALREFFLNVFHLAENLYHFFGKPLVYLTYYQVQLCAYGGFFKNILTGEHKPPQEIATDPDRLEDWFFGRASAEEELKRLKKDGNEDTALVGLTKKDRDFLGIDAPDAPSLKDKIGQAGGEISIEEIMKMEGL